MINKIEPISHHLWKKIEDLPGVTLFEIEKETGVSFQQLSRFMECGLTLDAVDGLARVLTYLYNKK